MTQEVDSQWEMFSHQLQVWLEETVLHSVAQLSESLRRTDYESVSEEVYSGRGEEVGSLKRTKRHRRLHGKDKSCWLKSNEWGRLLAAMETFRSYHLIFKRRLLLVSQQEIRKCSCDFGRSLSRVYWLCRYSGSFGSRVGASFCSRLLMRDRNPNTNPTLLRRQFMDHSVSENFRGDRHVRQLASRYGAEANIHSCQSVSIFTAE